MSDVYPESPLSSPPATATGECGCPDFAGRIYHQQGTCTDPVVARFAWYASDPAAAPELTAAIRERDDARKAFSGLAGHFTKGAQTGWTARVSGTVLRRLCVQAMCEPPSGSGDAPDYAELAEQMEVERNDARQLLANHKHAAARAHEELAGQRDNLRAQLATSEAELQEIHDALAAACGRDDLSEDTPAVVGALVAERDGLRALLAEILAELDQWELLVEDDKREEWRQRARLEADGG